MAFFTPFDPATPTDADFASEGDDHIRRIKEALIERLPQVIEGFPDSDPLKLRASAVLEHLPEQAPPVQVGTLAARPSPPAKIGLLYYAYDTDQLFVSKQGETELTWDEIAQEFFPVQVGTLAAQPNPPAAAGLLYFASDTQDLYVSYNNGADLVWLNLTPAQEVAAEEVAGTYTGTNTAGTRWAANTVNRKLYLRAMQRVPSTGLFTLPLGEVGDGSYHVDNIVTMVYNIDLTIHGGSSPIANDIHEGFWLDSATNTINFKTRGSDLDMWAHFYITFSS